MPAALTIKEVNIIVDANMPVQYTHYVTAEKLKAPEFNGYKALPSIATLKKGDICIEPSKWDAPINLVKNGNVSLANDNPGKTLWSLGGRESWVIYRPIIKWVEITDMDIRCKEGDICLKNKGDQPQKFDPEEEENEKGFLIHGYAEDNYTFRQICEDQGLTNLRFWRRIFIKDRLPINPIYSKILPLP